jgi:hypothetical protein
MFSWFWLADLCEDDEIPFTLGHALYMKAIHGGKAKNDRIDAAKIAGLLRGGMFPMAYVHPVAKRDLLRRRCFFVNHRSQLIAHVVNTNSQYNHPPLTAALLPMHRAVHELSRCAARADHEFRRGLDSSGTLPAIARHLSRIELAALLGLHVARRGFWDADSRIPLEGKEKTPSSLWEQVRA